MFQSQVGSFRTHSEAEELGLGVTEPCLVRAQGDIVLKAHLEKNFKIVAELVQGCGTAYPIVDVVSLTALVELISRSSVSVLSLRAAVFLAEGKRRRLNEADG
jgi:hypothetical protein